MKHRMYPGILKNVRGLVVPEATNYNLMNPPAGKDKLSVGEFETCTYGNPVPVTQGYRTGLIKGYVLKEPWVIPTRLRGLR